MDQDEGWYKNSRMLWAAALSFISFLTADTGDRTTTAAVTPAWDDPQNEEVEVREDGIPVIDHYNTNRVRIDLDKYIHNGAKLTAYLDMATDAVETTLITDGKLSAGANLQSCFAAYQDLTDSGWLDVGSSSASDLESPSDHRIDAEMGMEAALIDLRVWSTLLSSTSTKLAEMVHGNVYLISGEFTRPTRAIYSSVHCPDAGLIVSTHEFSPRYQITNPNVFHGTRPRTKEPPLTHWSDVTFLAHQHQCQRHGVDVKTLQHVFRCRIENKTTSSIVERAAQKKFGQKFPAPVWSHRWVFAAGEEGAHAILASPNGRGLAWMLLTHREQLGWKRVKSIAVFAQDDDPDFGTQGPSLYFELEDVPAVVG